MPIYEYRCTECQQLFEEWCKHIEDESEPHNCPICRGSAKRIISNTSFALKGGGWYVTEYGSKKSGGASEHTPASASEPSGATSGATAGAASSASGGASGSGTSSCAGAATGSCAAGASAGGSSGASAT